MRRASYNTNPIGNGPFRFRTREAGRRWVFDRSPDFPAELGGPAKIGRLVVAVVDEPTTKFAGLVSGELAVAGIAPTMRAMAIEVVRATEREREQHAAALERAMAPPGPKPNDG